MLLLKGRAEMSVLPAVPAVLLHTVLWMHELFVILLVQCTKEIAFLPAVTAITLHHIAMYI